MLGHLATDQRATGLTTTFGHTFNELLDVIGVESTHGHVVEEEQRLGTLADKIVHTHGHEIDADGGESVRGLGHERLGTDAIGGGDQDRCAVPSDVEGEESTEPADVADDLGTECGTHLGLDAIDGLFAGIDADAGAGIGLSRRRRVRVGHRVTRSRWWRRPHPPPAGSCPHRGTRRMVRRWV